MNVKKLRFIFIVSVVNRLSGSKKNPVKKGCPLGGYAEMAAPPHRAGLAANR